MNSEQARSIMEDVVHACGHPNVSAFTVEAEPASERCLSSWWAVRPRPTHSETDRTRAYLLAYLLLGGDGFPASGISIGGSFLMPDKGVIKSLLATGHLQLTEDECRLYLTESGVRLVRQTIQSLGR